MEIKKMIIYLPIILLLLFGCSVPTYSYLRNSSSKFEVAILKYQSKRVNEVVFNYDNIDKEIMFKKFANFDKNVKAQQIDSVSFKLIIPPKSTIFLEESLNFQSFIYKSIIIQGTELIDKNGVYNKTCKAKKDGLNKFLVWFDIE
jgi:hypothetical protein